MKPRPTLAPLLFMLLPLAVPAQQQQYVDDRIAVTVRDAPRNDAGRVGVVHSGDRVTVLETLGANSFARVRTSDGREGWVTARYLTDEPASRTALSAARRELADARSRITELEHALGTAQGALDEAQAQLQDAQPALALAEQNEGLRVRIADLEAEALGVQQRFDDEKAHRRTLLAGGGLVGAGALAALLLIALGRASRRRRWSDF